MWLPAQDSRTRAGVRQLAQEERVRFLNPNQILCFEASGYGDLLLFNFFFFCYTESSDNLFFVVLFIRYFFILFMIFSNLGKYLLNLLYVSVDPFLCKESSQYLFFSTCFQIFIHWLSLLLLFLAKGYFHTSIRISQMPFYVLTALVILNLFV